MINNINEIEILAPCGSYDIFVAAVKAGADACYLGGNKFGARAYAQNFDTESIIKAIDYAHLHGVKLYLTVNTLFKNNEINQIYDYLMPLYNAGLDAVIVQDLGAFRYIGKAFPDIHVHCSTQMNITSHHAAAYMKELGATRVVTAREMSLDEIKALKSRVDIEVETFVHGAMCYSYSGQCLMSSLAGGRSGNRGRCAQPCRKCYDGEYILSMKDMCTLENLPQIIDAGIDSLKIEGRMKNEYYVASSVQAYKELVNDYKKGCFSVDKAREYKNKLANIYNRGGFCEGYFFQHKATDMISKHRPNNQGVKIGRLTKIQNGSIAVKLTDELYKGDVLEVALKDDTVIDITSGISGHVDDNITLNAPKTKMMRNNQDIYRTRCNVMLKKIDEEILSGKNSIAIDGKFTGFCGTPLRLDISIKGKEYTSTVFGDIVETSDNRPANQEQIRAKLSQLGNTEYYFDRLDINISENSFIPAGMIKRLRREAIELLEKKITDSHRRDNSLKISTQCDEHLYNELKNNRLICDIPIKVGVINKKQLDIVLGYDCIYGIYMDMSLYNEIKDTNYLNRIREKSIRLYIELPYVISNRFDINNYLPKDNISGIYIRNIDGLLCINKSDNKRFLEDFEVIRGSSLYSYNDWASYFIDNVHKETIVEISKELNLKELQDIAVPNGEMVIYEHQQVMLSAQCIRKNKHKCNHNSDIIKITDGRGNIFYSRAVCSECVNIIYNGVPFCMLGRIKTDMADMMNIKYFRANFTVETDDNVKRIMDTISEFKSGMDVGDMLGKTHEVYTTGHYYRGVE